MVLNLDLAEFFKKRDVTPAYDSSGGGDYVNGVDTLINSKFNWRWNNRDEINIDLEKHLRINQGLVNNKAISYFYEQLANDFVTPLTEYPFQYIFDSNNQMDIIIKGTHSTLGLNTYLKSMFPTGNFIDFIREGEEEFSISVGSTNLFEVQTNYPTTEDRWYRLGHDGAEPATGELVTVKHDVSPRAEWAVVEVIFEDYQNNPSGEKQNIRITSTEHNEYVELHLDPDQSNYRYSYALWDGGSLQTSLDQDTGVARSTAVHRLQIVCYKSSVDIYVDNNKTTISGAGEYMQYVDDIEFESENNLGSADYFDIKRFNVYESKMFTLVADTTYYLYVDQADGVIKSTSSLSTALYNVLLYRVVVPSGATSIIADYVTDLRNLTNFFNEFKIVEDIVYATSLSNMPTPATGDITCDNQNLINVGTINSVTVEAFALDNLPVNPTGDVSFNGQSITNVVLVDGVDIAAISLSNMPSDPTSNVDFKTENIINAGTINTITIENISLNNMPAAISADLDLGIFNLITSGNVDGVDVSAIKLNSMPSAISGNVGFGGYDISNIGSISSLASVTATGTIQALKFTVGTSGINSTGDFSIYRGASDQKIAFSASKVAIQDTLAVEWGNILKINNSATNLESLELSHTGTYAAIKNMTTNATYISIQGKQGVKLLYNTTAKLSVESASIQITSNIDMNNSYGIIDVASISMDSTNGGEIRNVNDMEFKQQTTEFRSGFTTSGFFRFATQTGIDFLQVSGGAGDEVIYTNRKGSSVDNAHRFQGQAAGDADIYCRHLYESVATLDHTNHSARDLKGIDFSKHDWKDHLPTVLLKKDKEFKNEDGKKTGKKTTYIGSGNTLSYILHIIQKQQEEIDSLQSQINILKG